MLLPLFSLAMASCQDEEEVSQLEPLQEDEVVGHDDSMASEYVANQAELYQSWQLIGYGSEESFHAIDEKYQKKDELWGYRFYLVFKNDTIFQGRDAVNEFGGHYICDSNNITFGEIVSTKVGDGCEESVEYIRRLQSAKSYGIKDGNKLRLYYADNKFLYFEAMETSSNPVVGKWQLITTMTNFGGIYDYSNKNIEYQFFSEGVLNVSDDSSEDGFCVFLKTGEHQYALDEKTSKITIDGSTHAYRFKDKELIIDTGAAWDAPVYVFKRIK